MKQLGDDLLAGAVLAGDEHVGVRGADLRDQLQHRLHGRRASHELRHAFAAQQTVFHLQLARAAQRLMQLGMNANQAEQALVFPRLLDEVASAALDGFDRQIDVAPGGHHDHRQAGVQLLNARQQVKAFLAGGGVARVVQVDEQHVVVAVAQCLKHQLRRASTVHMNALRREQQLHSFENVRLIVCNQNANWLLFRDGPPPRRRFWRWRWKCRSLRVPSRWPAAPRCVPFHRRFRL